MKYHIGQIVKFYTDGAYVEGGYLHLTNGNGYSVKEPEPTIGLIVEEYRPTEDLYPPSYRIMWFHSWLCNNKSHTTRISSAMESYISEVLGEVDLSPMLKDISDEEEDDE